MLIQVTANIPTLPQKATARQRLSRDMAQPANHGLHSTFYRFMGLRTIEHVVIKSSLA